MGVTQSAPTQRNTPEFTWATPPIVGVGVAADHGHPGSDRQNDGAHGGY